ncbi:MAG: type II toxin-antitoxin system HipA family toxin YjjJ [Steroidobacteraceae bacterium]
MTLIETLIQTLRTRPHLPAAELLKTLDVSRATLMRAVRAAGPEVLTIARARRTSYAARRRLRGSADPLPVFQVDERGGSEQVGRLNLAYPDGTVFEFSARPLWPLDDSMRDGWFDGLPYFLQDLRPDGFLGRQFARAHAQVLQLGDDPSQWSDDDALYAISLLGADQSGNFVVGEGALRLWLDQTQQPPACLEDAQVLEAYIERAQRAMQDGDVGSSVAGEFPKFTALRTLNDGPTHVLVKFSGSDNSAGTQRWSDLLVCEHLAAQSLAIVPGLTAAQTSVLQAGDRTCLEAVRFDRHGIRGRSALCSWAAINHGWFGLAGRPWTEGAARLLDHELIDRDTAQAITRLWHFGQLIGNTDMHDGNLSFRPRISAEAAPLVLAPAYDMLPMLYAPQRGVELPPANFVPRLPMPAEREAWQDAAGAAEEFWSRAADDARISTQFRAICADNLHTVRKTVGLPGGRANSVSV